MGETYVKVAVIRDDTSAAAVLWFIFISLWILGGWILARLGAIRNALRELIALKKESNEK